jgi:2-C-methyl-D-erythritol 4-phosphate cytidylyltransferase
MSISAIIVAAGSGTRLNAGLPKAFIDLGGKPLFLHSLETFGAHSAIDELLLIVAEPMLQKAVDSIARSRLVRPVRCIAGGAERWLSVKNGANAATGEWLLVHDAARPFVTPAVIDAVLAKRESFDCVITATPETDTVRVRENDVAGAVVDRSTLVRVGTPQLFRRSLLLEAFELTGANGNSPPTDEAVLIQAMGRPVGIADGDPINFKITTQADRSMAEALVAMRSGVKE